MNVKELVKHINKKRMLNTFVELAKIDSESKHEKKISQHLVKLLKRLGCKVTQDNAGRKVGGECGNVIAKFPGDSKLPAFLLGAHMDTVKPGKGVKPKVLKDKVTSDGTTILGADCKSGLAIVLEILQVLKEKRLPHPPIEIAFTIFEEGGLHGSKNLDYKQFKAKYGLSLDTRSPLRITTNAPSLNLFDIKIHGVAVHSGLNPEDGISAIEVASKAISSIKFGRMDFETTSNIGIVSGGQGTNTVMPLIELKGEVRSHNLKKLNAQITKIKKTFEKTVKSSKKKVNGKTISAKLEFHTEKDFPNIVIPKNHLIVKTLDKVAKELNTKVSFMASGGGSDANIYFGKGIVVPNMGTGVRNGHTTGEILLLKEFYLAAEMALGTILKFAK
jgi:tripeptide aminopeptidase